MKVKLIILGLLLLSSLAWAEHGFLSTIPIIHPQYGELYQYESSGVYPLPDGSMYVLGTAGWFDDMNGIPWSYGNVVTRINANGTLMWHSYPSWGGGYQIIFIDIDAENSIHYIINKLGRYLVGKTDQYGTSTVGTEHLFYNQLLTLYEAKRLPNNEILMVGNSHGKALLARLTASGDTISVARFAKDPDSGYNTEAAIFDFVFDDEGNVLNLCKLSSMIHATILKTDIDGNILSRYDLYDSNFSDALTTKYIGESSDGGYEILMLVTPISSLTEWRICKYNNGEISLIDNLDYWSDILVQNAVRVANHRYYYALNYGGSFVYKTNSSGEIMWTWVDQRHWYNSLYSDCIAANGDMIIAIGSSSYPSELYAVELLPNGQVELDDDTQSPAVNVLSVYPNPMKDKLTINTQSVAGENTMLYIYNIRGQRIRSLILNGETVEWDGKDSKGADCPNGVYAIRLASNNAVSYITKIK